MTTGTSDKKKLIALCVLGAFALYMVWANLLSGPDIPATSTAPRASVQQPTAPEVQSPASRAPVTRSRNEQEFVPVFHKKSDNKPKNLDGIDPTLRLDLLAKVQSIEPAGGTRNLFEVGAAPPKPAGLPDKPETKVEIARVPVGPKQPPPPAPPPPPPPPAPIPLKLYAVVTVRNTGKKTACFLDGENILTAAEGETILRRYKLLQIRAKDVLMEDIDAKRQQSVPMTEEGQS